MAEQWMITKHGGDETPYNNGIKLCLISIKVWNNRKVWRLVEAFRGKWIFEGYEFDNLDDEDFDIVHWFDLPKVV